MFELLEGMRALRVAGASVELVGFDLDEAGDAEEPREQAMADAIIAARRARPAASFVALAGNLHASKREIPFRRGFRWMAMRLADAGLQFVGLGAIAASPPAAFPERAVGLDKTLAALASSPEASRGRARAAYDAGDFRGCAASIEQIAEPTADDAYTEACCLARAGDREAAVARLRFAVARGLENPGEAENDDDLASLRDHPRWPFKR